MISDMFSVVEVRGRFVRATDRYADDWHRVSGTLPESAASAKDYLDSRVARGEFDRWLPAVDASGQPSRVDGVPVYQLWTKFGRTLLAIRET